MEMFDGYPVKSGFSGPDWELEDCASVAVSHPKTFKVPSLQEAPLVEIGDLLRLHFVITNLVTSDPENPRAERMWVEVCQLAESGVFRGHLTNQPMYIDSLEPGDVIEFKWEHVAQVNTSRVSRRSRART